MFATASLAARIERAECTMLKGFADGAARRSAERDLVVRDIGGGVALYLGPGSPANKLAGLGFAPLPGIEELEALERAHAERGAPLQAEVSSLGDPEVARTLTSRGYRLVGFENVLGLSLGARGTADAPDPSIAVTKVEAGEEPAWMDALITGFQHPDTFDGPPSHESFDREAIERIFSDTLSTPGFDRYIARRDGEVAGGAGLRLYEGVAQLAGAATKLQHRRRGVQTALLRHRLRDAAARGCDVAVVTTQPGSKSTENVQRFGFSILYVRAILIKYPE